MTSERETPTPAPIERPVKRSLTLRGHRTSVSLELSFWRALKRAAAAREMSVDAFVADIDARRSREAPDASLASALRVALLHEAERAAANGMTGRGDEAAPSS